MTDKIDLSKLLEPFPADDIEWRAGATNNEKNKALAMAYITSRAVMNRLDTVCGPENWQDFYTAAPSGGVMCGISIRVNNEWIVKHDVGENTDFEAIKGGFSDAFKRAAVKWGIGRYLYNLDGVWVACETFGKSVKLKETPRLPAWALPKGQPAQKPAEPAPNGHKPAEPETVPVQLMPLEMANEVKDSKGVYYHGQDTTTLNNVLNTIQGVIDGRLKNQKGYTPDELDYRKKAIISILANRATN